MRKIAMIDIEKEAKQLLEGAKAENAKSKGAEPKGAATTPQVETPKTEEKTDIIKKAEDDASKTEELLLKKDPTPEEKAKKEEIVKKVEDVDKKSNVQKRIDELTSEKKSLESKIKSVEDDKTSTKTELEALRNELNGIKKELNMTPEDSLKKKVKSELSTRFSKYLDEDSKKPREERREMKKDELDEWLLEDYEGASEWLTRRSIRRVREEEHLINNEVNTSRMTFIQGKQDESVQKVLVSHPELDITKRKTELEGQGKGVDEIRETLFRENPKYKLCADILKENPEKYLHSENGPELIAKEMERRLSSKTGDSEKEDLIKRLNALEEENRRLKDLDIGIPSGGRESVSKTDEEKEIEKIALETGLDPKRVKARIQARKLSVR